MSFLWKPTGQHLQSPLLIEPDQLQFVIACMRHHTASLLLFFSTIFASVLLLAPAAASADCIKPSVAPFQDNRYYHAAVGKTGAALRQALHGIIKNHVRHSYRCVWKILEETDEDPNNPNHVILLYTARSVSTSQRDRGQNDPDSWNREHVWAKSHGFPRPSQYAYTDVHHLRPADRSVNRDRGNREFDNGGDPHTECTRCRYDSDSWEPPDDVKGDIARMLFYMDVRYEGDNDGGTPDLTLVDRITRTPGPGEEPNFGKLCTLVQWHLQDPVSEWEQRRNARIYAWQANRNPFIDHPEWVLSLWGQTCGLSGTTTIKQQLLDRLNQIEKELKALRDLIDQLEDEGSSP